MAKANAPKKVESVSFSDALGAQAPLGFWDPLNLLKVHNIVIRLLLLLLMILWSL